MYKLAQEIQLFGDSSPSSRGLIRLTDNAFISMDKDNADYQEYLKWLAEGNEPLPADAPPAQQEGAAQ